MPSIDYDLMVIGAGWFGLAAAKAYIQLHPDHRVAVIDSASSCGGTWAEHRLYPGLKSNNMVRSYEYPDFPMCEERYGVKPDNYIPADVLHRYLTEFAKKLGAFEKVIFNTSAETIERTESGGWIVHISSQDIPATLFTSDSGYWPDLDPEPSPGRRNTLSTMERVVIVGGGKSAYDISYAYADAGVHVDMVIRPEGNGPFWLSPPFVTPLKRKMEELIHTRCLAWFSPAPWGDEDGFGLVRKFLHGTRLGRLVVHNFWHVLESDVVELNGYEDHHYPGLNALKPWYSAFWTGSGVGIHNFRTSYFNMVKQGKIEIHTAKITRLRRQKVHLSTNVSLNAGAIICATGWKKTPSFTFKDWDGKLPLSDQALDDLIRSSDDEIMSRFPMLKSQPSLRGENKKSLHPLRLYRVIMPPAMLENSTLAFAGMISSVSTSICASLQGLWIAAYFNGKLRRVPKSESEASQESVLNSRWGKWRYPCGYGGEIGDFAFDAIPYFDLVMKDLGLNRYRKQSPMAEIIEPYKPWDYNDVVDEWLSENRS